MTDDKQEMDFEEELNKDDDYESTVSKLIKAVRQAGSYDDIGYDLYHAICYNAKTDPPYSEWVATWILKCIDEVFEKSLKADIMRASFALLPKYCLGGTKIQGRLERYLDESAYLSKYSSKSKRSIEDIKSDPNGQEEFKKIMNKLTRMDNNCLKELINYIEALQNAREHIQQLEEYGDLMESPDGKKYYKPKLEGLYYPKKNSCDEINIEPIEEIEEYIKSTDTETESDKTVVKIDFSNGDNVIFEGSSESKAFRDMVLDAVKLIVMSILTVTCFIRLGMNMIDYQATEKPKNGGYQPNKSVENYQPDTDWAPKAVPYNGETNQEPVKEYAETTTEAKSSLKQVVLLYIDLYLEDAGNRSKVDIASLGEDK